MSPAIPSDLDTTALRAERMERLITRLHRECPEANPYRTTEYGVLVYVGSERLPFEQTPLGWLHDVALTEDEAVQLVRSRLDALREHEAQQREARRWDTPAYDLAARLKTNGIQTCVVRDLGKGAETVSAKDPLGRWHSVVLRDGHWHHGDVALASMEEALGVLLERCQPQPSPQATEQSPDAPNEDPAAAAEAAKKLAHSVTITARILDTDALERAIKASAQRQAAHAKEQTMTQSKTQQVAAVLTADASEAGKRLAARQLVKLVRDPLAGLLTRHLAPGDEAFRARLAAFLETDLGAALLASMLSAALSAMPQAGAAGGVIARELRVEAMADAGDVLAEVLMSPLRQVMALYLQDPAGAPQLGVAQTAVVDFAKAEEREGVR